MGLRARASTCTRFWVGLGFGRGAEGLSLRVFSRPPLVLVYCHALIVDGGKGAAMASVLSANTGTLEVIEQRKGTLTNPGLSMSIYTSQTPVLETETIVSVL